MIKAPLAAALVLGSAMAVSAPASAHGYHAGYKSTHNARNHRQWNKRRYAKRSWFSRYRWTRRNKRHYR